MCEAERQEAMRTAKSLPQRYDMQAWFAPEFGESQIRLV